MLVKNWMRNNFHLVDVNDSMQDVARIMKENHLRMLPVMSSRKLVGIVTDGDIKRASASEATSLEIHELMYLIMKIKVKQIMSVDPITVPPDYTIEEAAALLIANDISGAPVVDDDGQVVGVITQNDIFKVLISISGFSKATIQLAYRIEDFPGSIKAVTDLIRNAGGRLVSILTSYESVPEGFRNVYIGLYGVALPVVDIIDANLKGKVHLLYWVDHIKGKRYIRQ